MNPQTNTPSAAPRPRRVIPWLAASIVLAGGAFLLLRRQAEPAAGPQAEAPAHGISAAQYAEARKTIAAFLTAASSESRADQVLGGSARLTEMKAWYEGREAEPLRVEDFQPAPWLLPDTLGPVAVLHAPRDRGRPDVVACVMLREGRWQLDWDLWRQSESGMLGEFLDFPGEKTASLRVLMVRHTPDGAPLALTLRDPFAQRELTLAVSDLSLSAQICRDLPQSATLPATVQVAWLNDSVTGGLEPRLRSLECWGFLGLSDPLKTLHRIRPGSGRPVAPPAEETSLAAAWGAPASVAEKTVLEAVNVATRLPDADLPGPSAPAAEKSGPQTAEALPSDSP